MTVCETCNGQCLSRGPRIGDSGVPLCVKPVGHEGDHLADSSWGYVAWGAPDMRQVCPDCRAGAL